MRGILRARRARERPSSYDSLSPRSIMSADAIHATLGIVFTGIWLLVGQILVGDR